MELNIDGIRVGLGESLPSPAARATTAAATNETSDQDDSEEYAAPARAAVAAAAIASLKQSGTNDEKDDDDVTEDEEEEDQDEDESSITIMVGKESYTVPAVDASCFQGMEPYYWITSPTRLVTKPHPSVEDRVISPFIGNNHRRSPWWLCYTVANRDLDVNEDVAPNKGQYCNFCGKVTSISKDFSPSKLKIHIQRHHPEAFAILGPLFTKDKSSRSSSGPEHTSNETAIVSKPKARTAAAQLKDAASEDEDDDDDDNNDESSVTLRLRGEKYTVPAVDFSFFQGMEAFPELTAETRLVTETHPTLSEIAISPFAKGSRRKSPWWIVYSVANPEVEANKDIPPYCGQWCNFCAAQINLGRDVSPYRLKLHFRRFHREAYELLKPIFDQGNNSNNNGSQTKKLKAPPCSMRSAGGGGAVAMGPITAGLKNMSANDIRALLEKEKKDLKQLEDKLRKKEKADLIREFKQTRLRKEIIKRKLGCESTASPATKRQNRAAAAAASPQQQQQQEVLAESLARQAATNYQQQQLQQQEELQQQLQHDQQQYARHNL